MISIREDGGSAEVSAFEREVHAIFSEDGKLSHGAGFEFRREQQDMACAVARTLERGRQLVVEAGTGVGKTRLALQICRNIIHSGEGGALVFSLEMSRAQLVDYLICLEDGRKFKSL